MAAPPHGTYNRGAKFKPNPSVSIMRQKMLEAGASKEPTAVVGKTEMDRIKQLIEGGHGYGSHKKMSPAQMEDRKKLQETGTGRKDKMMSYDRERQKHFLALTPEEIAAQKQKEEHIKLAKRLQDETNDEVKMMNKVILYSKCVAIRDMQGDEKKQIREERAAEDKKLELVMEMERLKVCAVMITYPATYLYRPHSLCYDNAELSPCD